MYIYKIFGVCDAAMRAFLEDISWITKFMSFNLWAC